MVFGLSGPAGMSQVTSKKSSPKKNNSLDYDSDIDPDDLLPVYLESKEKLFHQKTATIGSKPLKSNGKRTNDKGFSTRQAADDPETAKILRKLQKIEDDVLFDRYLADQQWNVRRIQLEKEAAARRNTAEAAMDISNCEDPPAPLDSDDEISREAEAIGAAMLEEDGSDDDGAIAELFASLPVNEVDPLTGKSSTVINGLNGIKITIRDFGKWTGINPTRVLEEACRARYITRLLPIDNVLLTRTGTHPSN